jgi:hypothetical protein
LSSQKSDAHRSTSLRRSTRGQPEKTYRSATVMVKSVPGRRVAVVTPTWGVARRDEEPP